MIDMIIPFIRDIESHSLPPYRQFLHSQQTFIQQRYQRFIASQGHESPGIKLLRYILQFVDLEYLNLQPNNYERYTNHLRYIRRDMMNIFDRVQRGRGYRQLFFAKNKFLTEEFLLPIEDVNSIVNLPLYTEDWNVWKRVRVLRLWTHDSSEYSLKTINDAVAFRTMAPSYAIELLDVVALVFKFFIWNKHQRHLEEAKELAEYIPQQLFLHKYVLDGWIWDLSNIWLIQCLKKLMTVSSIDELSAFESHSMQTDQNYGWISLQARKGFEALWKFLYDTSRNRRPEALLSSPLLFGGSLNHRIQLVDKTLILPITQPYEYLRWMRDKDLVELYLSIWKRRPDLPTTKTMMIHGQREYQRMLKRRPWQTCQNILLKNSIEQEMLQKTNLFHI